ncbi:unnamed protein product [Allacma fusca]|uniref:CFA20 domain-containing protein n=1 Tax=Allacma fusca TaxID=39272 RepID=A0A8J2NZP9_9HEXA|nr:unnamed protein product [Allacma fusca]
MLSQMIVDSDGVERKLRGSTLEPELEINDGDCTLPLHFTDGWNQVQIDLNDFTSRCFGSYYGETMSVKVSSNCQLHRVYFCESANNNHPHKFSSSALLHSNLDTSPGGSGDGFDLPLH